MPGQPALPGLDAAGEELRVRPGKDQPRGPVARVVLDTPVPHLSQPFDYLIPDGVDVVPGIRVQVRLAGRRTAALVTEVIPETDHAGTLRPLEKVVSSQVVLVPEVLALAREVAAAYAGSLSDVLRLAIPPRHATVERDAAFVAEAVMAPAPAAVGQWDEYTGGPAFLRHLEEASPVRAVWTALPGVQGSRQRWVQDLRAPVAATLRAGSRVLVLVPTTADVEVVADALADLGSVERYHGDLDAAPRYRAFLRILAGGASVVVGTRSAAFAPVPELGLVVVWDPEDESLAERHAPYPSALGVSALRRGTALLVGSVSRSVVAQQLVEDGHAVAISAPREVVRAAAPRVHAPQAGDIRGDTRRIPSAAFDLLRTALQAGPVLVHVPRAGYLSAVRCASCGSRVRCRHCGGPLSIPPRGGAQCQWCARPQQVTCSECGGMRLAAYAVGSERTTDELGRAFPGVPVTLSNARVGITRAVGPKPRLVIATPGSEPVAEGGYAAALILDAAVATARPELAASSQALDRWLQALSLVRPAADGGVALLLGEPDPALAQACVRWDPAGWARRELAEREDLHFPPAWRLARITGPAGALRDVEEEVSERVDCEMLGPSGDALLLRVPRSRGRQLTTALKDIQAERSAKKEEPVRVQIDPLDL